MKVTVVDYGLGNLRSVFRALEHVGGVPALADSPQAIIAADRLVLPGVGAFADGMRGLEERHLIPAIHTFLESGRPFLGICLGMQLLFESADEFGHHQGLGVFPGIVTKIPPTNSEGRSHKVPHVGWSPLFYPHGASRSPWDTSILQPLEEGACVYFVHSYAGYPAIASDRLADTLYNGVRLLAALRRDNITGCQFHPEKSGPTGLKILQRFLAEEDITSQR